MTTKIEAAKQKAFEDGSDYAVTYITDMAERVAKAIEDTDPSGAALLNYIAALAYAYNCGEYQEDR